VPQQPPVVTQEVKLRRDAAAPRRRIFLNVFISVDYEVLPVTVANLA
jgi:hypothetical protein